MVHKHIIAVPISGDPEQAKRIDLLMKPFEEAFMTKHTRSQFRSLGKKVAFGQNPVSQFSWPARRKALREREKCVDFR